MIEPIDILLITFQRIEMTIETIDGLLERTKSPFNLYVVDNGSTDGTIDYLISKLEEKVITGLSFLNRKVTISDSYNLGFEFIESELFVMMQNDVIVPDLDPDWLSQLKEIFLSDPNYGGVACRIQHVPKINPLAGSLVPATGALSAYCRMQRLSDIKKVGGLGKAIRDDATFVKRIRGQLGKKCLWTNKLWCNHLGHSAFRRGYLEKEDVHRYGPGTDEVGIRHPYPEIDPKTNIPLDLTEAIKKYA